jgi:hypothetical protein
MTRKVGWRIAAGVVGVFPGIGLVDALVRGNSAPQMIAGGLATCAFAALIGALAAHKTGRRAWPWGAAGLLLGLPLLALAVRAPVEPRVPTDAELRALAGRDPPRVRPWIVTALFPALIGMGLAGVADDAVRKGEWRWAGHTSEVRESEIAGYKKLRLAGGAIAAVGLAGLAVGLARWSTKRRIEAARRKVGVPGPPPEPQP